MPTDGVNQIDKYDQGEIVSNSVFVDDKSAVSEELNFSNNFKLPVRRLLIRLMKKKSAVDFSDIYSPRSQIIINKHKLSASKHSPSNRGNKLDLGKIKKKVDQNFIVSVPQIDRYKTINRIALNDKVIENINGTLDIEAKTARAFDQRVKTQDFILRFQQGSFVTDQQIRMGTRFRNHLQYLLKGMEQLRSRDFGQMLKKKACLTERMENSINLKVGNSFPFQIQLNNMRIKNEQARPLSKNPLMELDEIVNMRDEIFFNKSVMGEKNIFKLISNPHHHSFKSNKEKLQILNFSNDSILISPQKQYKQHFSAEPLAQISTFSRQIIKNVISDRLPDKLVISQTDIRFNLEKLGFEQLMLVATNKLRSGTLLKYMEGVGEETKKWRDDDEESKEPEAEAIIYTQNTAQHMSNYNPVNQDRAEIIYYIKQSYLPIETKQKEISSSYKRELKRVIKEENETLNNSIRDRLTMRVFEERKDRILTQLLEGNIDKRLSLLAQGVEKRIRSNKMDKNMTEKIKIDLLKESISMKKRLEFSSKSPAHRPTMRKKALKTLWW